LSTPGRDRPQGVGHDFGARLGAKIAFAVDGKRRHRRRLCLARDHKSPIRGAIKRDLILFNIGVVTDFEGDAGAAHRVQDCHFVEHVWIVACKICQHQLRPITGLNDLIHDVADLGKRRRRDGKTAWLDIFENRRVRTRICDADFVAAAKVLVRAAVLRQVHFGMADRRLGCLSIFLFVALCASLFVNFVLMIVAFQRFGGIREAEPIPRFREILLHKGAHGSLDKIAVITMRGLISSSIPGSVTDSMVDDMRAALQQAREDRRVKAIVLEIDSPGGEVTASDEIYNAVVKTRAKKPVVVYMDSLAASGGYYVSCGGRFLMANETTITGSIGVIIQTLNYEQLFNKIGLASVVFKSGKFKDMLNGARPITPEERELVQNFIMSTYDKFLGIVAKERNVPADLLRNTVADGRILSGKEALQNKLIDGLGELDDAFAKAKELGSAPDAKVVKYGPPFSLARLFRVFGQSESKIELQLPKQLVPQLESGRAYFLPSYYAP
jgi:protease-4